MNFKTLSYLFSTTLLVLSCDSKPWIYLDIQTEISGRVFDNQTGKAIEGSTIRTKPISQQVSSNADGYYLIETNVSVGESYTVYATKSGYIENNANVIVREGENISVDIRLNPEGPIIETNTKTLNFGARKSTLPLTISNIGSGSLNYTINEDVLEDWLTIIGDSSATITDISATLTLKVNRTGIPDGKSTSQLVINSNGGDITLVVSVEKLGED